MAPSDSSSKPHRTPRRARVVALTGVTLAAALGLGSVVGGSSAATAPAANGCADVEIIMIRGTNEAAPAGAVVPGIAAAATQMSTKSVSTYAVSYPATNDFGNSAAAGLQDLTARMTAQGTACPAMKFALVGFEQGASVISFGMTTGISAAAPALSADMRAKVAGIVLLKDPTHKAGDPINVGTATVGDGLVPRPVGAMAELSNTTKDFCDLGDPVCASGQEYGNTPGYYAARYTGAASYFLSALM